MTTFLLRIFSQISRYFQFDLLWRISRRLDLVDRRYLAWRLMQPEAEQVTFRRDRTLWTVNILDSVIASSLFQLGNFQGREMQALLAWMKHHGRFTGQRNVIIDVGANIGTTSIPFAQETGCYILAIEPVPESFKLLEKNVAQNGWRDRITCVQKAVSSRSGNIEMAMPESNCGGAFVKCPEVNQNDLAELEGEIREKMKVPSDTLINIIASCQIAPERIAFVWSDTEGCEAEVIATGKPLWLQGLPLYVEIFPLMLKVQNGLTAMASLVTQYFDRYLASADLIQRGVAARHRPIAEFAGFLETLTKNNRMTDVLLLPKGFEGLS